MDQNLGGIPRKYGSDHLIILLEVYVVRYYAQSYARCHELNHLQWIGLKSNHICNKYL